MGDTKGLEEANPDPVSDITRCQEGGVWEMPVCGYIVSLSSSILTFASGHGEGGLAFQNTKAFLLLE